MSLKNNSFIIIAVITVYIFIHFWFFDDTPKKTHCNPNKEYCPTLNQFDSY